MPVPFPTCSIRFSFSTSMGGNHYLLAYRRQSYSPEVFSTHHEPLALPTRVKNAADQHTSTTYPTAMTPSSCLSPAAELSGRQDSSHVHRQGSPLRHQDARIALFALFDQLWPQQNRSTFVAFRANDEQLDERWMAWTTGCGVSVIGSAGWFPGSKSYSP